MNEKIKKSQYKPKYSVEQITKLIQQLQEILKQTHTESTPTTQPTQTTYIEGFGYVSQGSSSMNIIGESNRDINKIVGTMK